MARTQGSHSGITGPRVRQAALELFAHHGYAAVSMRRIAAAVGVQVGALYNYTPDKQALLFSLMKEHMDDLITACAETLGDGPPAEQLDRFVRFHIAFNLDRPEAVFISYMELRNLDPQHFSEIESLRSTYESQLETILRGGAEQGAFHVPDPKITTLAVIGMLTGTTTWYREGGRLSVEEVQGIYCDMVRKVVSV